MLIAHALQFVYALSPDERLGHCNTTYINVFRCSRSGYRLGYHSINPDFILISIVSAPHSVAVWHFTDL